MRLADALIVPSPYLVEVFQKFGLHATPVANMIDVDRFKFHERNPLRPIFLSNRNLYPLYNVACIVRAFAIIQQKFPEARLTIAGGGRQRAALEALVHELKLRNVEFLGLVAPDKMGELYDEAHIFLNSSNIDNMPGSILDSFASGLPVVSTNAGGIPWIVTHERTGLLVPKNDHEAMAACAIHLLESPALTAAIARNAYEECPRYTWEAVRKTWLTTYMELAGVNVPADTRAGEAGSYIAVCSNDDQYSEGLTKSRRHRCHSRLQLRALHFADFRFDQSADV